MPMAWAFQKESELLNIFNYYLEKMQQSGVIDRLRQKFIGDHNRDTGALNIQALQGLGYANVVFPFLALLTGLCAAFMQLGIETVTICKKKCFAYQEHSNEDESTPEGAREIIDDMVSY